MARRAVDAPECDDADRPNGHPDHGNSHPGGKAGRVEHVGSDSGSIVTQGVLTLVWNETIATFPLVAIIGRRDEIMRDYPECYACSRSKTSMEHVPAKCFFPAADEYRLNLYKVPSCDLHNSLKSGDDLYAAIHVAPLHGEVSHQDALLTQLRRSLDRDVAERGGALVKRIHSEVVAHDGVLVEGRVDAVRMKRWARLVARGIYFWDRCERWEKPLRVAWMGNDRRDPAKTAAADEMTGHLQGPFRDVEDIGVNPTVFRYAIADVPEHGSTLVRLTFYDSFRWWVFFHPDAEDMETD